MKFIFPSNMFVELSDDVRGIFLESDHRYGNDGYYEEVPIAKVAVIWIKYTANSGQAQIPVVVELSADRGIEMTKFVHHNMYRTLILGEDGEVIVISHSHKDFFDQIHQSIASQFSEGANS